MAKLRRYIPILLLVLAGNATGQAQTVQTDSINEIWMTEAELESFLTRIALRKKEQMERRQQASFAQQAGLGVFSLSEGQLGGGRNLMDELRLINDRVIYLYNHAQRAQGGMIADWQPQSAYNGSVESPLDVSSQINALNAQIGALSNALQAERLASGNTYDVQVANAQRSIDELNNALVRQQYQSTPIVIQGGNTDGRYSRPVQPIVLRQSDSRSQSPTELVPALPVASDARTGTVDSTLAQKLQASSLLNFQLQEQIDELYERLYGDRGDSILHPVADAELLAQLAALASEIDQLKAQGQTELSQGATTEDGEKGKHLADPLVVNMYRHSVYFANNSTEIGDDDLIALSRLKDKIKASDTPTTIILRGFSSTTGNAQYNVRLSSQRADMVKETLVQMGVEPKDIVTLYHGPDDSKREDLARRVEVTLSAY